ncbi:MAG: LuxR C-terminal-related transcriptional regulator [Actinobacteria bacterium]|nr:LuxR C-terminal-related transcriptional regulator [Actinomycetota bacterium]
MELVGRRDEMALAGGFLGSVHAEKGPRALVLRGEPGAGKTALLNRAYAMADGTKLRVNAQEALQNVALSAAGEMLRDLDDPDAEGTLLAGLISGGDQQSPLIPVQIYESVRRRLIHEGTTLFIDDLQWLDAMSLGLVHFLVSAARSYEKELRVVAATRPGLAASAFIEGMERACLGCEVIEVGGLGQEEGVELIRGVARNIEAAAARAIWERARGVPYWMIALSANADAASPGSVLEARLQAASADAVNALTSLAALGRPVDTDELGSIEGWDHSRAMETLDELEGRGLVRRSGSRIHIVHDLIREAVAREASDTRMVDAHRRIARWLGSIEDPSLERRVEAIEHRLAAGLPATSAALELAQSETRFILGEGGLSTITRVADSPAGDQSEELLIAVASLASDVGLAELALDRWSIVFHRSSGPNARAWAALEAASAAMDLDRPASARQWIDLAEQTGATEPAVVVEGLAVGAGLSMYHEHDVDAGLRLAEESVRLADTTLDASSGATQGERVQKVRLHALHVLHDAHMMRKDHARALSVAESMVRVASTPMDRLAALTNVGITLRHLGRIGEAASVLEAVWTEANRTALLSVVTRSAPWYAGALIEQGRLDKAREVATEGRHIADRLGLTRQERLTATRTHAIDLLTADWRAGIESLRSDALVESDPHWRLALHELIAAHLSRLAPEDSTRALAEIEAAYQDARVAGCKRCMTDVLVDGISIAARAGDAEEAGRWLERHRRTEIEADPFVEAKLDHALALLSQDPAALTLTAERFETFGMHLSGMWARLDLAGSWVRQGHRPEAADAYRSLAADAASIGAFTIQEAAEKGLRQLGVRTWRRGETGGASGLTGREQEVASLVASGASNPEIAETLFLSRKTVERHVSNILAKTGCRNRIELARVWGGGANEGSPR